jgi:hypothetical protein
MTITQLIRRHEKTQKGPDGKKLDKPTPEGLANAYRKGMDVKRDYPEHVVNGYHSKTDRAYDACAAWLMGADALPVHENIGYDPGLDSINIDHETRSKIRDMPDKEKQMRLIFSELKPQLEEAGKRIANSLIERCQQYIQSGGEAPSVDVKVTHGPVIDAAYLTLIGQPITYENAMRETGIFNEGEGFDVTLRKGNFYVVELQAKGKKVVHKLDKLAENTR